MGREVQDSRFAVGIEVTVAVLLDARGEEIFGWCSRGGERARGRHGVEESVDGRLEVGWKRWKCASESEGRRAL